MKKLYEYMNVTDGIMNFAELNQAFWLIEIIAHYIARELKNDIYFIETSVKDNKATIIAYRETKCIPDLVLIAETKNIRPLTEPSIFRLNVIEQADGTKLCILSLPNED